MKYIRSKAKYAADIFYAIAENCDLKSYHSWVEPFVGGANMMAMVVRITEYDRKELDIHFGNKIGNDINPYLIRMFQAVQKGWEPSKFYDKEAYKLAKENAKLTFNPLLEEAAEIGFIGIGCSYAGKWFGGYARGNANNGKPRNYTKESKDNLLEQSKYLKDVFFCEGHYKNFNFPINSIIYCDPPYFSTTKYKYQLEHSKFWDWCNEMEARGHRVFVSEYQAPDGWECIWQKEVNNSLTQNTGAKKGIEKLFAKKYGTR